jgi:hypothetical protein
LLNIVRGPGARVAATQRFRHDAPGSYTDEGVVSGAQILTVAAGVQFNAKRRLVA